VPEARVLLVSSDPGHHSQLHESHAIAGIAGIGDAVNLRAAESGVRRM
jgi:hypothetical protein